MLSFPGKNLAKKIVRKITGDFFHNAGEISELDFEEMRKEIDKIQPKVFIEIGTGTGSSTQQLFFYMSSQNLPCEFYTIEIFKAYYDAIRKVIVSENFHPVYGLSVSIDETTDPARSELTGYDGPRNVLRKLLANELAGRSVDMAFIDSRKGTALSEFKLLIERLSPNGAIFCHDILNRGKGVEVLSFLQDNDESYKFKIIDTGPSGIIKIQFRQPSQGL